ncbi:putative protein TPRXL, partial [Nilaparvata lugens]|uniref:putative protein TPRXL n=1 Tax=Nilaparvata lugens TaxID=108931 RepID=UPI00193D04C0
TRGEAESEYQKRKEDGGGRRSDYDTGSNTPSRRASGQGVEEYGTDHINSSRSSLESGAITAVLKIPVPSASGGTSTSFAVNLDDSDIPYIEDNQADRQHISLSMVRTTSSTANQQRTRSQSGGSDSSQASTTYTTHHHQIHHHYQATPTTTPLYADSAIGSSSSPPPRITPPSSSGVYSSPPSSWASSSTPPTSPTSPPPSYYEEEPTTARISIPTKKTTHDNVRTNYDNSRNPTSFDQSRNPKPMTNLGHRQAMTTQRQRQTQPDK